ncbi:benzaldehyde dehydrogenase (plasmid) [Sphingomonas panacis]|uniref:Benzaldehyde dehydrogenase n=1 Tax=Sphingomonas panacis TaxID=1560345 RepID=A0A1B3ZIH8_9SPHN|nr:aldehyde dehydrogenase family protein [Sphingomonas panacis]AOH87222.1 benzaldehyde dehydrogenase [Sphingomonas panacis]AOH87227.1 benzaldehyde dehydrogenase [Sphingomonas panacis]
MNIEVHTKAAAWHERIYVGGSWEAGAGGVVDVREPATGDAIATVGMAGPADVDVAVAAAVKAQVAWAETPATERARVLRTAGTLLEERKEEFIEWLVRESGSTRFKAGFEVASLAELYEAAALPTQPEGMVLPSGSAVRMSFARRVPVGVVGVITPWNFPLAMALRAAAPALALGNAVVLKPDPKTPVSGGMLLVGLFEEAGLPPGLFSVLPGGGDVGEALVGHPDVGMISFTGSTAVGRAIGRTAGGMLKKVSLELGGNNALIVLEDADLDKASAAGAFGSFFHQGQVCIASGRHFVHRKIADQYIERLAARANNIVVGDPFRQDVGIGPIISAPQLAKIDRLVQESVGAGASLAAGGTHDGPFYRPTVLAGVTSGMSAFTNEIFGPVAPVTVFDDEDEAVALANDTEYGLSAAVISRSPMRALAVGRRLKSGMVHINDQTAIYEVHAPFGGVKSSGNGARHGSLTNHEEYTVLQWVTINDEPPAYPF